MWYDRYAKNSLEYSIFLPEVPTMKTLLLICLSLFLQSYAVSNNTNLDKGDVLFKTDLLTIQQVLDSVEKQAKELDWNTYSKGYREILTTSHRRLDSLGDYKYYLIDTGIVDKKLKYSIILKIGYRGTSDSYVYVIVKDTNNNFLDKKLIAKNWSDCFFISYTFGVLKDDLSSILRSDSSEVNCGKYSQPVMLDMSPKVDTVVFDTVTKKFVRK